MSNYRELLQGVIDHPTDHSRKLVFADWLEEKGGPTETSLAVAMRWCAARNHFPAKTPHGRFHRWSTLIRGQHKPAWPHQLPRIVFAAFRPKPVKPDVRFRDAYQAYWQLARALEQLREAVALTLTA